MLFYNDYEITEAANRFHTPATPNLYLAARSLSRLAYWANRNSDGWHSWPKPARSAKRLMEALDVAKADYYRGATVTDLTPAQLKSVLSPVKSFLTRQGAHSHDVLGL